MAKLLSRSATITIVDYGLATGAPVAGASTAVCAFARSVRESSTTDEIDQTALCDSVRDTVPSYMDVTVDLELYVSDTLRLYDLRNHWVRVTIDPDGAALGETAFNIDGRVVSTGYDLSTGESQIERMSVRQRATAF